MCPVEQVRTVPSACFCSWASVNLVPWWSWCLDGHLTLFCESTALGSGRPRSALWYLVKGYHTCNVQVYIWRALRVSPAGCISIRVAVPHGYWVPLVIAGTRRHNMINDDDILVMMITYDDAYLLYVLLLFYLHVLDRLITFTYCLIKPY